jgi:glycerophosphoryl diester phosphodiesterase
MNDFFTPAPRALGHRGNSRDFPENTEIAFRSAIEMGIDVVETDVRLMKDGQVLISHDPDFYRLSGDKRPISSLCTSDLEAIDTGYLFSKDGGQSHPFRNKGVKPLLLRDAFQLFPETRFNIDLKDPSESLATATAKIIIDAGAENRVCVASFHHKVLKSFRKSLPSAASSLSRREMVLTLLLYRTGWIPSDVKNKRIKAVQIPEYAGPYRILRPSFYKWCRRNHLALQVWTINDAEKMKELYQEGVDGLFSDIPEDVIRVSRKIFGKPEY